MLPPPQGHMGKDTVCPVARQTPHFLTPNRTPELEKGIFVNYSVSLGWYLPMFNGKKIRT